MTGSENTSAETELACGAVVPGGVLLPAGLIKELDQQAGEHATTLLLLLFQQCCCCRLRRVWHLLQGRQRLQVAGETAQSIGLPQQVGECVAILEKV